MEKAVTFRTIMNGPYRDHPSEDALERFLLNQSEEEELEIVETHVLACESCVTRLETLELNLEATKIALKEYLAEQAAKVAQPVPGRAGWFSWLTVPRMSFAGAALAACAITITLASVPRQATLVANRGADTTVVSEWIPLDLHLDARDLPVGPLSVQVIDSQGNQVWQGEATAHKDVLKVQVGRLKSVGEYFVRVYSPAASDAKSELLREYSLQAKPLF
jgi:hypothetical protein